MKAVECPYCGGLTKRNGRTSDALYAHLAQHPQKLSPGRLVRYHVLRCPERTPI